LIKATSDLEGRIKELVGEMKDEFAVTVYFDEAHTLYNTGKGEERQNAYFALMKVLAEIAKKRVFFVFLSTNSSLNSFAPTSADYPSDRVNAGGDLIPPFFELSFDAFYRKGKHTTTLLTLEQVCKLEHVVKTGRPM